MTRDRIIERVRKLLALSNSSNEHEAALAAAHAQRLLAAHNLAMSEIELQEEGAGELGLTVAKTVAKWLSALFATVADAFDCFPVVTTTSSESRLRFIGAGDDPGVAICTLEYLIKELRRLASIYLRKRESEKGRFSESDRKRIRTSYLLGAVHGVRQALAAQKIETPTTSRALVPVKDALIRQYVDENLGKLKIRRNRSSTVISSAFQQGKQDGASLQLRSDRRQIES